MQKKIAIAVFLKTPELSMVKTRLANTSSAEVSKKFFKLATSCIQSTLRRFQQENQNSIQLFLALAEKMALDKVNWVGFSNIWQGPGDLGYKLHRVYQSLNWQHDIVLFMGMDSPQIDENRIQLAIRELEISDCTIGKAHDGGFYLFGGKLPIEKEIWLLPKYSARTTTSSLIEGLNKKFIVSQLPSLVDVDQFRDLSILKYELLRLQFLSYEQQEILNWIGKVYSELSGSYRAKALE